jgi:3-oxoacyl-[acyl-carrier protein] reductase
MSAAAAVEDQDAEPDGTPEPQVRPVAVVSGGSRGLGQVLVERLLAEGWRVATFSRKENDFVLETAGQHPDAFFWAPADLGDPRAMSEFGKAVGRRFGRCDLLVNNAGVLHQGLFLTTGNDRIETLIANNLTAPIQLTQACAKLMVRAGGGSIINVSSINAIRGFRGVAVYAAAKAGLDGFSRALARELGAFNIRVNSVIPGYFDSDMTAGVTDLNREKIQRRTPLGRLGTAQEVANSILFLASPHAKFVTGQALVIDGGITC